MAKKSLKPMLYLALDANLANNPGIVKMMRAHGNISYYLYVRILQYLRLRPTYTLPLDYENLAYEFREADKTDMIRSIVEDFGLFVVQIKKNIFYEKGLIENMKIMQKASLQKTEASLKANSIRWQKKPGNGDNSADAETPIGVPDGVQPEPLRTPNLSQIKENKNNETKLNETKTKETKSNQTKPDQTEPEKKEKKEKEKETETKKESTIKKEELRDKETASDKQLTINNEKLIAKESAPIGADSEENCLPLVSGELAYEEAPEELAEQLIINNEKLRGEKEKSLVNSEPDSGNSSAVSFSSFSTGSGEAPNGAGLEVFLDSSLAIYNESEVPLEEDIHSKRGNSIGNNATLMRDSRGEPVTPLEQAIFVEQSDKELIINNEKLNKELIINNEKLRGENFELNIRESEVPPRGEYSIGDSKPIKKVPANKDPALEEDIPWETDSPDIADIEEEIPIDESSSIEVEEEEDAQSRSSIRALRMPLPSTKPPKKPSIAGVCENLYEEAKKAFDKPSLPKLRDVIDSNEPSVFNDWWKQFPGEMPQVNNAMAYKSAVRREWNKLASNEQWQCFKHMKDYKTRLGKVSPLFYLRDRIFEQHLLNN